MLTVYAKQKEDPNSYRGVLRYNLSALSGSDMVFPDTFDDFREKGVYLYYPLTGNLKARLNQTFKLMIPGAEDVAIISGQNWSHMDKSGNIFNGETIVGKGEVDVGAKYFGSNEYSILLRYKGI